jgi:hypothetical protein
LGTLDKPDALFLEAIANDATPVIGDLAAENARLRRKLEDCEPIERTVLAHLLLCSFRYCLGRMAPVTGDCADCLTHFWHVMPERWKRQIHIEIRDAIENGWAGHECDVRQWRRVLGSPAGIVT